ncbi:MAG: acylphosphatase [Anaerolineales bacterium]|nr:acylphosphatase [Anaerolineales bacterium]
MQPEPQATRIHAVIEGRVQGVGFRAFTQRLAVSLRLTGWVRNRWDGSVETMAEGQSPEVEKFLKGIRRGPYPGTTRGVKFDLRPPTGEFKTFRVRMTA